MAAAKDLDELAPGDAIANLMTSAGRVIVVDSQSNAELSTLLVDPTSAPELDDRSLARLDWLEADLLLGVTIYGMVAVCELSPTGAGSFKCTKIAADYFGEYMTMPVVEGRAGGFRRAYVAHLPPPLDMLILAASDQPRRMVAIDVKKMRHDVFGPGSAHPDSDQDLHGYCQYLMNDDGTGKRVVPPSHHPAPAHDWLPS